MRRKMTNGENQAIVLDQNVEYMKSNGWIVEDATQEVVEEIIEDVVIEEDTTDGNS